MVLRLRRACVALSFRQMPQALLQLLVIFQHSRPGRQFGTVIRRSCSRLLLRQPSNPGAPLPDAVVPGFSGSDRLGGRRDADAASGCSPGAPVSSGTTCGVGGEPRPGWLNSCYWRYLPDISGGTSYRQAPSLASHPSASQALAWQSRLRQAQPGRRRHWGLQFDLTDLAILRNPLPILNGHRFGLMVKGPQGDTKSR